MAASDLRVPAPGPTGHRVLGSMRELRRDIIGSIDAAYRIHGDLVRFRVGPKALYAACSPELAEHILVKHSAQFPTHETRGWQGSGLFPLAGNGLLTNPDHQSWFARRRLLQPMFHRSSVASMGDKIVATGETMLRRWCGLAPGSGVDVVVEMLALTLDIICDTMFSADVLVDRGSVGRAMAAATAFLFRWNLNPLHLPIAFPAPGRRAFFAARAEIDRAVYGMLDRRLASRERHEDLLQMLMDARDADTGAGMTRQELRDEMVGIFFAGHETIALALSWAWYLLSQHPAALAAMQAEVDRALGGRPPALDDLPALPYTRAVLQEALRLYPSAPLLLRRVPRAVSLGGYSLEAETRVAVSIYSIHRRADLWEQPEAFRPERFIDPPALAHRLAYMPFGAGQHLCIGNHFAMLEGQLLLALLAQHYRPRLAPGQHIAHEYAVTLRPKYGMRMLIDPRNRE